MQTCRGDPVRAPAARGSPPLPLPLPTAHPSHPTLAPTPKRTSARPIQTKKKAPDLAPQGSGAANGSATLAAVTTPAASVAQCTRSAQDRPLTTGRSGARPRARRPRSAQAPAAPAAPIITGALLLPVPDLPDPVAQDQDQDQEYHCPGCGAHPDPRCSACGAPTAVALLLGPYGYGPESVRRAHCMTFCTDCHALLLQLRERAARDPRSHMAAAPLVYVPLHGHQTRSSAARGQGSIPGASSDVRTPDHPVALQQPQTQAQRQERVG